VIHDDAGAISQSMICNQKIVTSLSSELITISLNDTGTLQETPALLLKTNIALNRYLIIVTLVLSLLFRSNLIFLLMTAVV